MVGLDLNISNVAFVADDYAGLLSFADRVPTSQKEIRQLQRKMERSRRANNPDTALSTAREVHPEAGIPARTTRFSPFTHLNPVLKDGVFARNML